MTRTLAERVGGRDRVIGGPFGSKLTQADYTEAGVPVIRGGNMGAAGRWIGGEFAFVSNEKVESDLTSNLAFPGDVIVTQRGTLGQISIIPKDAPFDRFVVSQSQMAVDVDPEVAEPLFVYYYLLSPAFSEYVAGSTIQTGVPHINLGILRDAPVIWPPLAEQRAIAGVLGALDDKIEANRRMNATLEVLARALFKSWFVDFERSIERVTAETLRAQGVLEIGDGYRAKNDEMGEPGLPFIRAGNLQGDIDTHDAEILSARSVSKAGNKLSKAGDVAFTSKGTVGRFSFVTERTPQFVYSPQLCFWRSLDWKVLAPSVLYTWMLTDEFQRQIDAVASQTDMAPYVSLQDQRRMLVPKFPDAQQSLATKLDTLISRRSLNQSQSRTLAELRDLLLPKLLSGALRVRDAERLIGDAA